MEESNSEEQETVRSESLGQSEDDSSSKGSTLIIFFVLLVIGIGGYVLLTRNNKDSKVANMTDTTNLPTTAQVTINELMIDDLTVGTGAEAIVGKTVTVNYLGTLTNGDKFDSSYDRGTPFSFILGAGEVIQGWDKGVAGMKVGGKRKLTIPPSLGYGDRNLGVIPPNSTLVFEVELVSVGE